MAVKKCAVETESLEVGGNFTIGSNEGRVPLTQESEVLKFAVGGQQCLLTDCSHALESYWCPEESSCVNSPVASSSKLQKKQSQMTFPFFLIFSVICERIGGLTESTFQSLSRSVSGCSGKTETFMTFAFDSFCTELQFRNMDTDVSSHQGSEKDNFRSFLSLGCMNSWLLPPKRRQENRQAKKGVK